VNNKQGVSLKSNRSLKIFYENEQQQITLYLSKYDKKKQLFKVKYSLPPHKWGRISPERALGLSLFHRPTRHAYCENIYIDIDMKNAHPEIIRRVCKLNNYTETTLLDEYCEHREEF
jgi:hypothetical protein